MPHVRGGRRGDLVVHVRVVTPRGLTHRQEELFRELAEIELLSELPDSMDVAVGLVDVKNTWIEPSELVAERLQAVLKFVEPARVSVTPDCGFSQTARHVAVAKARALAEGAERVRKQQKSAH